MQQARSRIRVERFIRNIVGNNVDFSMLDDDSLQELAEFVVSQLRAR